MALTLANSNYNGEVLNELYLLLGVGNEVVQQGAAVVLDRIAKKKSLPKLSQTTNPIGDYVSTAPTADTMTTTWAERSLDPKEMMVYEEFLPEDLLDVWEEWQSVGDFTNLELNQKLMMAILELTTNGVGEQMAKLFWQGDTSLAAGDPMNKFDGIVTRLLSDANAILATPQGNISATNYFDVLSSVWQAIPDKFLNNPDFALHMNTTDYKVMQTANTNQKKDFVGIFGMDLDTMYQMKKIKFFSGMKRHHIVGAIGMAANSGVRSQSNLHLGVWVPEESETVKVDLVDNAGKEWFMRLDYKADANYRSAEDIVLYKPTA